jgi:hypothetical protein
MRAASSHCHFFLSFLPFFFSLSFVHSGEVDYTTDLHLVSLYLQAARTRTRRIIGQSLFTLLIERFPRSILFNRYN